MQEGGKDPPILSLQIQHLLIGGRLRTRYHSRPCSLSLSLPLSQLTARCLIITEDKARPLIPLDE